MLRVHSAEPAPPGYVAGTVYGSYARQFYPRSDSPRDHGEQVGFGAGFVSFSYAPTSYVELAIRGAVESQFVEQYAGPQPHESVSQVGAGDIGFHVKTLLTPADMRTWMIGAEGWVASSTRNEDALVGTWYSEGVDVGGQMNLTYAHRNKLDESKFAVHMNAGYLGRTQEYSQEAHDATQVGGTAPRSVAHGNQFLYGAGAEVEIPRNWSLFAEWSGEYDTDAGARFEDNPMRVTPGLRWQSPGGTFAWTAAYEMTVSSEESAPPWQVVSGITLGGQVTPVQGHLLGVVRDADTGEPIGDADALADRHLGRLGRRRDPRHRFVHVPRASAWPAGRPARRRLVPRLCFVRDAGGPACLCRFDRVGCIGLDPGARADWAQLPSATPPALRRLIERCLDKDSACACGILARLGSR